MKFYDTFPDMECLSGDTLPEFSVEVETADELGECSMQLIVSKNGASGTAALTKNCVLTETGFAVQLNNIDTTNLGKGDFLLVFSLTDANGNDYRKLCGRLSVRSLSSGGSIV